VSRYILGQAVACGGTARGFNQGVGSASCGVFASDWLADRLAGTDAVFQKTTPVAKDLRGLAFYFAGTGESGVDGRYSMGTIVSPGDGPARVEVTVRDYVPTKDYASAADDIKKTWGSMAVLIIPRVTSYLQTTAGLVKPGKDAAFEVSRHDMPATGPADDEEEKQARLALLAYFRNPGMNLWSLAPVQGTGHFMATNVTATEFWIFDSLVGEAMIPLSQLDNWFGSPEVVRYLNKYRLMTAMNFVPQRQYG
jgi:hypothetical protein